MENHRDIPWKHTHNQTLITISHRVYFSRSPTTGPRNPRYRASSGFAKVGRHTKQLGSHEAPTVAWDDWNEPKIPRVRSFHDLEPKLPRLETGCLLHRFKICSFWRKFIVLIISMFIKEISSGSLRLDTPLKLSPLSPTDLFYSPEMWLNMSSSTVFKKFLGLQLNKLKHEIWFVILLNLILEIQLPGRPDGNLAIFSPVESPLVTTTMGQRNKSLACKDKARPGGMRMCWKLFGISVAKIRC